MLQSIPVKTLVTKLVKTTQFGSSLTSHRLISKETPPEPDNLLPKADPDLYGHNPDPLEHAFGYEKKMMIARLMGDDRYEDKIYYRCETTTRDYPNLVPCHLNETMVLCHCEPEDMHIIRWVIRKDGAPKRCMCGHWFKAIDADPEYF